VGVFGLLGNDVLVDVVVLVDVFEDVGERVGNIPLISNFLLS
jgi:hypothetical protein